MPPQPAGGRGGQGQESVKHGGHLQAFGKGTQGDKGEQPVEQDLWLWGPATGVSTHAAGKAGRL